MDTAKVFALRAAGPAEWQPAPAPNNRPHFARKNGADHHTLCLDSWLNSAIFGKDYEWAEISDPPRHTIALVEIRNPKLPLHCYR